MHGQEVGVNQPPQCVLFHGDEDRRHGERLVVQLTPAVTANVLRLVRFDVGQCMPRSGPSWTSEQLNTADYALILVSPRFLGNIVWDMLSEKLQAALERRPITIVPIILDPCSWEMDPVLANYSPLPVNGKTVRSPCFFSEVAQALIDTMKAGREGVS